MLMPGPLSGGLGGGQRARRGEGVRRPGRGLGDRHTGSPLGTPGSATIPTSRPARLILESGGHVVMDLGWHSRCPEDAEVGSVEPMTDGQGPTVRLPNFQLSGGHCVSGRARPGSGPQPLGLQGPPQTGPQLPPRRPRLAAGVLSFKEDALHPFNPLETTRGSKRMLGSTATPIRTPLQLHLLRDESKAASALGQRSVSPS